MSKQKQTLKQEKAKDVHVKPQQEKEKLTTAVSTPSTIPLQSGQGTQTLSSSDAAALQRTIGNQAVGRLTIQRKMTLGPVGDKYEQEADTVAKQVVSKLNNSPTQTTPAKTAQRQEEDELQMKPLPTISTLQRQEEEEEVQMKPLAQRQEEEEEVQAKRDPMLAGGQLNNTIENKVQSAKSSGQPLNDKIRQPMEQAFNTDFSHVKIHTDNTADNLNRTLSARAFTSGQDVFFRQGEYQPSNTTGQELLAHELTHVVQQNSDSLRRKGIEPGDKLPEMESMTAAHLKNQLDLGTEQQTRTDAIGTYKGLHELGDAQANINKPLFMMNLLNIYAAAQSKQLEDFSETFVSDFVAVASPLIAGANTLRDAKVAVLRAVAAHNPEYVRFGSQFFASTVDYTEKQAKEAAPEARDENTLAQEFLEGREDVTISDQITSKRERKAFTSALKEMVTVQLLLNPPKKGVSGMGHGWKDGGSVADVGNIVAEPPETGNSVAQSDFLNGNFANNVEAANNFIKFIVEPHLLREINKPEIHVHLDYSSSPRHPKGFRAFQSGKTVHVAQNEDTAIIVHEIGHYLEANLPTESWHDIRLLIEERHKAKGGGANAGQGAGGRSDKEGRFEGDYAATGKYTSRAYASGDTEMMSMTLEYLANKTNAKKMVEKDPQQAAIILRGVRPREYAQTAALRPFDKYLPQ